MGGGQNGAGPVRARAADESNGAENGGHYDYDLFSIGSGTGGTRACRFAAQYGARVAVCELPFAIVSSDTEGGVGGTCVLRGCIPKKLLLYGSYFSHEFEEMRPYGWTLTGEVHHDMATLQKNKNKEVERLNGVYKKMLSDSGVDLIEGRGKIAGPNAVEVNGRRYTAKRILVATGSAASVPPLPGKEHILTSDHTLSLSSLPKRMIVVGSGYIALEQSAIFAGLGTEVTIIVRSDKVLKGFDEDVRTFLQEQLVQRGLKVVTENSPTEVVKNSDGTVTLKTDKGKAFTAEAVLFATGRKPKTKGLGLEDLGVELDKKGGVVVNEYSQSTVPSIYAIGDVTNRKPLTPAALMEGMAFAKTVFGKEKTKPDYEYVPAAVFTHPQLAYVGLTEDEAKEKYGDIDVYTSTWTDLRSTMTDKGDKSFGKMIVAAASKKVVGIHMVGSGAPEIVQGYVVAMKMGATKADFDSSVGIHPTSSEEFVQMRTPSRKVRKDDEPRKRQKSDQTLSSLAPAVLSRSSGLM